MTNRSVAVILMAALAGLALTPGIGRAQAATITVEQGEAAFRKTGRELRRLELGVLSRLEEVTPLGLLGDGHSERMARELVAHDAEAAHAEAQLAFETAEVAVLEFEKGTVPVETETISAQIALAKADIERAEDEIKQLNVIGDRISQAPDREELSGLLRAHSYVQGMTNARLRLERAKSSLEEARSKREVFEKYTKRKRQLELAAEVAKAKSVQLRKKSESLLAQDRVAALNRGRGTPLTREESEILGRLDAVLATWKKAVALRGGVRGGPEAKRAELVALVADVEAKRGAIEHDWEEVQEDRLVERDELTATRIRQVLKRPASR